MPPAGLALPLAQGVTREGRAHRVHVDLGSVAARVRRGDRLPRIAARYHLPASEIRAANPKIKGSNLRTGMHVTIPAVAIPSALAIRAAGGPAFRPRSRSRVATHQVRSGETLIGIAHRYRVSLKALRRVNALPVEYTLRAGKRLRIPS